MISIALQNKTGEVIKSFLSIKEAAQNENIDSQVRKEQLIRIDKIINTYKEESLDYQKVSDLTKEEFGGSFGNLIQGSGLQKALIDHYTLTADVMDLLKNELLLKYLINKEFESQPLVSFEERHGGPLWFDLKQFRLKFLENGTVHITIDKSLSKDMSPLKDPLQTITSKYELVFISPNYFFGKVKHEDGRAFHFESLVNNQDYLYLEHPHFWKESLVLKGKGGTD